MTGTPATAMRIEVTEEHYPRYDPSHGTPDPMTRRVATLTLSAGVARFEQTDYGHPGRFNAWESRGIDTPLLPRTDALRTVCEAVSPLFG